MLDCITKIWTDDTLYGHCLTNLPSTMWNFATSEKLVTYANPDPGSAERIFLIFEKFTKTEKYPNGEINSVYGTNSLLFKYSEIVFRRIVGTLLTAGATLTAAPLGFAIKIIQKFANQPETPVTLASEIGCAKKDILDRGILNVDFNDAKSAKLFLVIKHGGNIFSKTVIMSQDVNKEQTLKHLDTLVNDIQKDIIFDSTSKTEMNIGILATDNNCQEPVFSCYRTANTTSHYGKISNPGSEFYNGISVSNIILDGFCDAMGVNRAPQIDAQGNFI